MFSRNFDEIRPLPEAELREVGFSADEAEEAQLLSLDREIRAVISRFTGRPRSFALFWWGVDEMKHAYAGVPEAPAGVDPIAHYNAEASRLFHLVSIALPTLCDHRRRRGDDGDDDDSDDEPLDDPDPGSPDMAQS
jgi:hypothetical protein